MLSSRRRPLPVMLWNHVAIFLAIAFWRVAWGVPGILLAVPILRVVEAICDRVDGLKGVGEFLRD